MRTPSDGSRMRSSGLQRAVIIGLSLVLYISACVAPALEFSNTEQPLWTGVEALALGWLGVLHLQLGWLANPLMWGSILFVALGRWKQALTLSLVAAIFGLSTMTLLAQRIPADEAGVRHMQLETLHIGYPLWLGSVVVCIIGSLVLRAGSVANACKLSLGNLTHR